MPSPTSGSSTGSVSASGSTHIDALVGGSRWGSSGGLAIGYSFPDSNSEWDTRYVTQGASEPFVGFAALNATQQDAFRSIVAAIAEVADISFTEVSETSSNVGDIRIAFSSGVSVDAGAHAYYPSSHPMGGDIWLNTLYASSFSDPDAGTYGFETMMHELGHALGLKHPFDTGGTGVTLSGAESTTQYTMMAYDAHPSATIYTYQPGIYDIAALQWIYGANTGTRTGSDTYSVSASEEEVRTIWDAGGTDRIDASNQTRDAVIDLREGAFSSIGVTDGGGAASNNVAVAYGATIENAAGGSGDDTLTGNSVGNELTGLAGYDYLYGLGGDDTIYGNTGLDVMVGGDGDDWIYGGQNAGSQSGGVLGVMAYRDGIEYLYGDGGDDLVYGNHGSDVISGGDGADTIYGGQEADTIEGGAGSDYLLGDLGDDWLTGGTSADRFHVKHGADTITDFSLAEGDTLSADGTLASVTDGASGAVVVFSDGSQVTLIGVASTSLTGAWLV